MLYELYNTILQHLLHPPLSPTTDTPLLLRYIPLLTLLTLFWPIFTTLLTASLSASAWLFWLCIGATTGVIQLLYVLYNFFMIVWDLVIIVNLKTFSLIRSRGRRYYYRVVFATYKSMGIERRVSGVSSGGQQMQQQQQQVRRKRKEWSMDVARASNYKEFEEIEIYEPIVGSSSNNGGNGSDGKVVKRRRKKRLLSVTSSKSRTLSKSSSGDATVGIDDDGGGVNGDASVGLRRRRQSSSEQDETNANGANMTPPTSPIPTIQESTEHSSHETNDCNGSPIRKIHSCLEFKRQATSKTNNLSQSQRVKSFRRSKTTTLSSSSPSIKRTYSSSSLPPRNNHGEFNDTNNVDEDESWQNIVKDDLGMEGGMLLTTLARLKEARLQAASQGSGERSFVPGNDNEEEEENVEDENDDGLILPSLSSLSKEDEDEPTTTSAATGTNRRKSSYHITASFNAGSKKRTKKWNEDYSSSLKTLLSGIVKRNHLSIEDWLIQDGRSVAERGQHSLRKETRDAIDRYGEEVERCMDWIARGPVYLGPSVSSNNGDLEENEMTKDGKEGKMDTAQDQTNVIEKQREELSKRYTLVKRMKQNVGHTALMLSGGGAQTMYHLGSIKALVEAGIYQDIHVISGTSGGSITAAMCAIKTPSELLTDICVRTVATDYMLTGEQKRLNVRWFPTAFDMGKYFLKNQLVCDGDEFKRCCDFYYKDITFEEAYQMTGKHVCITVTASRASSGRGLQRLLLNHISTPNVTLASAVRASCAVPGVFAPATLMIKDSRGKEVPFEVDGVQWIDGSVQADIPTKRISTLFNISRYVVCQTNFHVVPFIHKSHHPSFNSLYWKLFQLCMNDAGNRLGALSRFGLISNFYGNDLSKMLQQRYYGDLTLVPKFTTAHKLGLSILSNPDEKEMDVYLQGGQAAAWPFIRSLQEMLHLERSIDKCLKHLGERLRSVSSGPDLNFSNDELDSVSSIVGASNRARLPGLGREAELLREKVKDLEQENEQLKMKVQRLQRALGISQPRSSLGPLDVISVEENEVHDDE